uniref:Uncharacterized protein n=1 Tax=Glossina austeni TaxID=7395 RepID=A0A1A9VEE3_GLOAU
MFCSSGLASPLEKNIGFVIQAYIQYYLVRPSDLKSSLFVNCNSDMENREEQLSAPTDRYVGNSEYDHLYRQYVGIESSRNPEFINGWFSKSFNKSSMAAMMNAATNKVLHINVHELLIENRSLREKLKEVITDRDRLLCEVSNLRLELDMAELKRLPEERCSCLPKQPLQCDKETVRPLFLIAYE